MSKLVYERNVVYRGPMTERFFFVRKARVLENGIRVVTGQRIDVTEHLQPYLLKRFRRKVIA